VRLPNSRPPSHGLGLLNLPFSVSEPPRRIMQHFDGTVSGTIGPCAHHVHVFVLGYIEIRMHSYLTSAPKGDDALEERCPFLRQC
jgi:hypothetical protein